MRFQINVYICVSNNQKNNFMSKIQQQIDQHQQAIDLLKKAQSFEPSNIVNHLKNDKNTVEAFKIVYDVLIEQYGEHFGSMVDQVTDRMPVAQIGRTVPDPELLDALKQYIESHLDATIVDSWYNKHKNDPQANRTLVNAIRVVKKITQKADPVAAINQKMLDALIDINDALKILTKSPFSDSLTEYIQSVIKNAQPYSIN